MSISILVTGDTFLGGGRVKALSESGESETLFGDFLPIIQSADLAITNLESPIIDQGTPISKTGPAIKSSIKSLDVLKKSGFGLVTLANNHIMDFGADGLFSTIKKCNEIGLKHVGAAENLEQAKQTFYTEIAQKKIAIVNIAENEFGTTNGSDPGGHPLDPIANFYTIKNAKENADFVIVIVHGGHELYAYPSPRMKKTYRYFVDAGADFVIGHHTHWYSGYETYVGAPIFYSLGNFLFDTSKDYASNWHTGFAVKIIIGDDSKKFEIIPYSQNTEKVGVHLLNENQRAQFDAKINDLNTVIQDDVALHSKFEDYVKRTSKLYSSYLEPHSFRIVRAFQNRKLLPSFLTNYKRKLFYNLIRCEAHRDVVLKNLDK